MTRVVRGRLLTFDDSPRRAGVEEILYPGEKSQRLKREREQANMIAIPESHYQGLCTVADEFGLARPELV